MPLPARNPIVRLWRETESSGQTLDDAITKVTAPKFLAKLSAKQIAALRQACEAASAEELRLPALLPLCRLNFEAARVHPYLDDVRRAAAALTLLKVAPGRGTAARRVQLGVATAALGWLRDTTDCPTWAHLQGTRGIALAELGDRVGAKAALEEALALWRALAERQPEAFTRYVAGTLDNLGRVLNDMGDRAEAKGASEEALELYRALAEREPEAFTPDLAITLSNLGKVLREVGDRPGAKAVFEEVLGLYGALAEGEPEAFTPDVAMALSNLGAVLGDMGDGAGAKAACERALGLVRALAEREPEAFAPDLAATLNNLGTVLGDSGDPSGAKAAFEEALGLYSALAEREPEAFTPQVGGMLNNLGNLLRDMGDRAGAKASYEEALALRCVLAQGEPGAVARAYRQGRAVLFDLDGTLFTHEHIDHTVDLLELVPGFRRALAEPDPQGLAPDVAMTLYNLALLLREEGSEEQARRHATEALMLAARQKDLALARQLEELLQDFLGGPVTPDEGATEAARAVQSRYGARLRQIGPDVVASETAMLERLHWEPGIGCQPGTGELIVARDWASWTTIPLVSVRDDAIGGGYLVKWGGKGLAIDPGLGFTTACRKLDIHLSDINAVAVTHYHVDHSGDVPELATCFFEAQDAGLDPQAEFFLAPGPWYVYGALLSIVPGVKDARPLPAGVAVAWNECSLTGVGARHHELTGQTESAIGLRLDLPHEAGRFSLGVTSDTSWDDDLGLGQAYAGADVLVLHLGSLYYRESTWFSEFPTQHLGLKGAVVLLEQIVTAGPPPKLVLISEWGQELEAHRQLVCEILRECCGVPNVCPALFGTRVSLPQARVKCDAMAGGRRRCDKPATKWGYDPSNPGCLCFRCDDPHHGTVHQPVAIPPP